MKKVLNLFYTQIIVILVFVSSAYAEPDPEEAPPKVTRQQIQEKMKSGFQKKFLTETEDPKYASVIAGETWSAVSETFALEGMTLSTLQEFKIPHLENVNKVLTEVGLGMALAQYVIDLANDNEEVGTLNLAKSLALYGLSKSAITILNSASLAISWVDYALNKLGTTAIGARYEKWEDAYRRYYSDTSNSEVWHSYEDWKEALKDAHTESEINGVIFGYLDGFWMGDDCEAYLRKGHWLFTLMGRYSLAMPDKKERTKIRNEYFRTVLSHKIRPYLYRLGKERAFDFYKKRMEAFRDKLSALYKLNIKLKSPEDPVGEMTYTVGPWVRQTKEDGTHMLIFRMYAYIKSGMPEEIVINLPEGDLKRKIPKFPKGKFERDLWFETYIYVNIDAHVLDKNTQKTIKGAELKLQGEIFSKEGKSDDDGRILVNKIPAGEYKAILSAPGYKEKKGKIDLNKPRTKAFTLEPEGEVELTEAQMRGILMRTAASFGWDDAQVIKGKNNTYELKKTFYNTTKKHYVGGKKKYISLGLAKNPWTEEVLKFMLPGATKENFYEKYVKKLKEAYGPDKTMKMYDCSVIKYKGVKGSHIRQVQDFFEGNYEWWFDDITEAIMGNYYIKVMSRVTNDDERGEEAPDSQPYARKLLDNLEIELNK